MPSEENGVNGASARRPPGEVSAQLRLAGAIIGVTRELKRSVPAPHAAPYFGLDIDAAYDPALIESLSSRGIFRKYELVLLVDSGLGGLARWLSRRLGCRILGVDADVAKTSAARRLNDVAGMAENVSFAAGERVALPFRDRVFTHVWMIDPSPQQRSPRALEEAFRVLRSGAHFAAQFSATGLREVSVLQDALSAVGFVDVNARATAMMPFSHTTGVAKARLRAALGSDAELLNAVGSDEVVRPSGCFQLFCKRP